ncbi:hypothetical protein K466DRAFT_501589, partial [Polyporus arcularius HHB13444]
DAEAQNWPNGAVIRERQGPSDQSWNQTKWAWCSRGRTTHNGQLAEARLCLGSLEAVQCDAVAYHYKVERNGTAVEVLSNPRAARYAVGKSLNRLGIQAAPSSKGGLTLLHDLGALNAKLGTRFVVESSFSGPTYFVMQTPFMEKVIEESVADWITQDTSGPDAGRHGFVTDGDQSFFRQGTLLATCAFSTTVNMWLPVLYSWIDGLDTEHHRPHFRRLNQAIVRSAGSAFQAKYLTAIMDFSRAQRLAHAEEFADAMTGRNKGWSDFSGPGQTAERTVRLDEASLYQQGCHTHYQRSAMRLKKNQAIIPPHLLDTFEATLQTLLAPTTTLEEYKSSVDMLRSTFPPVLHGWLDWWHQPKIAAMIFPACRVQDSENALEDFRQHDIPKTSNPVETQHSLLHHATGTSYDLIPGIEATFRHTQQLEKQYVAAQGVSGNTYFYLARHDATIRVLTSLILRWTLGPTSPSSTLKFNANDGRAPDTYEALQDSHTTQSAVKDTVRKKWKISKGDLGCAIEWVHRVFEECDNTRAKAFFALQHQNVFTCSCGQTTSGTSGPKVLQYHITELDTELTRSCSNTLDNGTVHTIWPQVLQVIPSTRGASAEAFDAKTALRFPLNWSLPAEPADDEYTGNESDIASPGQVSYTLVGRVLFHPARRHFTTQIVMDGRTYDYDSMARGGRLSDVGRDLLAEVSTRAVVMAVYHRLGVEISRFKPLGDDHPLRKPLDAARGARDPFDSDSSSDSDLDSFKIERPTRGLAHCLPYGSPTSASSYASKAVSEISIFDCAGCGASRPAQDADADLESVQCDRCNKWSHMPCVTSQFDDLPDNLASAEVTWKCPQCSKAPLWDDAL